MEVVFVWMGMCARRGPLLTAPNRHWQRPPPRMCNLEERRRRNPRRLTTGERGLRMPAFLIVLCKIVDLFCQGSRHG